jgi:hypothetical protein
LILNNTIAGKTSSQLQTGDNLVLNETAKQINFLVNGKNSSKSSILMKAYRCIGPCPDESTGEADVTLSTE